MLEYFGFSLFISGISDFFVGLFYLFELQVEARVCAELISGEKNEDQVHDVGLCGDQMSNTLVLILSFLLLSIFLDG